MVTLYLLKFLACGWSLSSLNPIQELLLIQGGHVSEVGDFPWMAAIYYRSNDKDWEQICGGTLISPNLVITGK